MKKHLKIIIPLIILLLGSSLFFLDKDSKPLGVIYTEVFKYVPDGTYFAYVVFKDNTTGELTELPMSYVEYQKLALKGAGQPNRTNSTFVKAYAGPNLVLNTLQDNQFYREGAESTTTVMFKPPGQPVTKKLITEL